MMEFFTNSFKFLFSPRLYRVFSTSHAHVGIYRPNTLEKWGDCVASTSIMLCKVAFYIFPVLTYVAYQRGYFVGSGPSFLFKITSLFVFVVAFHIVLRSVGRATNPTYVAFHKHFSFILNDYNSENKKALQNYDFDFYAWPVDFDYNKQLRNGTGDVLCKESFSTTFTKILKEPYSLIGYVALHTLGIKLMYPGSISALNYVIQPTLQQGRKKLIEEKSGERFKLKTPDSNELDVFFIDRRHETNKGSTLIICTEGNAGFYEIGIMATPLELGYSIFGWNHPGFGCSTGTPYVDEEYCAMETIMQFAFQRLNFTPENIILFGWSIGGFASSFAASKYPDIGGVVLDATFDNILPLARRQIPAVFSSIVNVTIQLHANLNIAENLITYNGPIRLIRRSEDEIIALVPNNLSTNRGNHLLVKLLKHRYPNLFTEESESILWTWLSTTGSKQDTVVDFHEVNVNECKEAFKSLPLRLFPSNIGADWDSDKKVRTLIFVAGVYMKDFQSTHCTTLPPSLLESVLNF